MACSGEQNVGKGAIFGGTSQNALARVFFEIEIWNFVCIFTTWYFIIYFSVFWKFEKKIKNFENSKFCFLKKVYMPKNATKKFQIIFFHCLLSSYMFPNKKMYSISDGFSMAGAITMPFTFYEKSDLGSAFHS